MKTTSIYARKTAELVRNMNETAAKIVYSVAAALYYLSLRKKTERGLDKLVVSCYNGKKERMFLLETKITNKESSEGGRE